MNDEQVRELENILSGNLSDNNEVRQAAHKKLLSLLDNSREPLVFGLVKLLRTASAVHVRSLAAIFLRQHLPNGEPELYSKLSDQLQGLVKQELLQAMVGEPVESVRNLASDLVAELAKILLHREAGWKELLPCLYQACASGNEVAKCSGLTLWAKLSESCPDVLQEEIPKVGQCYATTIKDASVTVRARTVMALCKTIGFMVRSDHVKSFHPFIPEMLSTLGAVINDDVLGKKVLFALVDLAGEEPKFFRPQLGPLSEAMAAIGTNNNLEDGPRQLALECLVQLAERAEVMIRKSQSHFIRNTFGLAMSMMVQCDDEVEWCKATTVPDLFDGTNLDAGETALDRMAMALGGEQVMTTLWPLVQQFLGKPDWRFRHAALRAIGQVGEAVPFKNIPFKQLAGFVRDPSPRVRYGAIVAIGQLSVDHQPTVQKKFAADIIPPLVQTMGEFEFPRLQHFAGAALFNFLDRAKPKQVNRFVEPMLNVLVTMLQRGVTMVKEQALTTMAGVAGATKKEFAKFYPKLAPMLKQVLVQAQGKEFMGLRSKAMESLSFMGMRVGPELFYKDAEDMMKLFTEWKRKGFEADDASVQYMLQACTRICSVLGEKFAPALPHIMPDVFKEARRKADWTIVKELSATDEEDITPIGVRMHNRGFTSQLEDKSRGCSMMCSFAHDMKEHYLPYVQESLEIFLPLMDFTLSDDVRSYSITGTSECYASAMAAYKKGKCDEKTLQTLFVQIASRAIECFDTEQDMEMLLALIGVIKELVRLSEGLASKILDQQSLQKIGAALMKLLEKSHRRIAGRAEKRKAADDDVDELMLEKLDEEDAAEDQLNFDIQEAIEVLIKEFKEAFLPTFEGIAPQVLRMMSPESLDSTKKIGIFIWDDVVENVGPAAGKFFPAFAPLLLRYLASDAPVVRQAAGFGIGAMAQYGGAAFAPFVDEALKGLMAGIKEGKTPVADEEPLTNWRWTIANSKFASPTDNMVSALGRIALYQNRPEVAAAFLAALPLVIDDGEADAVYGMVCTMVEKNHPVFMGQNMANLPKIIGMLLDIYGTQFCSEKVEPRAFAIISKLKEMPKPAFEAIVGALTEDQREDLRKLLSGEEIDRPIPSLGDEDEDGETWDEEQD